MSTKLFEKYRPKAWNEVIGQDAALRTIHLLRRRGLGGRAFWISGPSGVGKTTIARLLAREIAEEFFVTEIDAQQLTTPLLRQMRETMRLCAWGKGGRVLIVNEAHGLRADVVRELLVWLEELPAHAIVIFTTTTGGEGELALDTTHRAEPGARFASGRTPCDAACQGLAGRLHDFTPLLSRCIDLRLECEPAGAAEHVKRIAAAEGLDGAPLAEYERLAEQTRYNLRAMLNAVEAGQMMQNLSPEYHKPGDAEVEYRSGPGERVVHV